MKMKKKRSIQCIRIFSSLARNRSSGSVHSKPQSAQNTDSDKTIDKLFGNMPK
jgi:hypothetical protein